MIVQIFDVTSHHRNNNAEAMIIKLHTIITGILLVSSPLALANLKVIFAAPHATRKLIANFFNFV